MGSPAVPENSQEAGFHVVFFHCLTIANKMNESIYFRLMRVEEKKSRREDERRETRDETGKRWTK